jgi:hypothetical protein
MRPQLRSWLTFVSSLLCFGVLIASRSDVLDELIVTLVWAAFLVGSVVLVIKNIRQPAGSRGLFLGQTSWLPANWRRWVVGDQP